MKFVRPRCYFDVELSDIPLGRIVFELYSDICPITCENFRSLCTGEKGIGKSTGKNLHYLNIVFHRVVKGFMVQSGDFSVGNGTGGESIYGGTFEDENFELKHDEPFLLSMANRGKDTNGSQFFITTQPAPHLDGIHVVFGHVVSGQSVVSHIENLPVDKVNRPLQDVRVVRCNELVLKSKLKAKEKKKASDNSASSGAESEDKEEGEQSDSDREPKRKKKRKKEKKRKKKKKRSSRKHSGSDSAEDGPSEEDKGPINPITGNLCKINPSEIPDVPANKFLYRVGREVEKGDKERRERPRRKENIRGYTKSGRVIKGRGVFRYRTPSRSRSRSFTPPHWKQAETRTIKLAEFQKLEQEKQEKEEEIKRREEARKRRHEEREKEAALNEEREQMEMEGAGLQSKPQRLRRSRIDFNLQARLGARKEKVVETGPVDYNALDYDDEVEPEEDSKVLVVNSKRSDQIVASMFSTLEKNGGVELSGDDKENTRESHHRPLGHSPSPSRRRAELEAILRSKLLSREQSRSQSPSQSRDKPDRGRRRTESNGEPSDRKDKDRRDLARKGRRKDEKERGKDSSIKNKEAKHSSLGDNDKEERRAEKIPTHDGELFPDKETAFSTTQPVGKVAESRDKSSGKEDAHQVSKVSGRSRDKFKTTRKRSSSRERTKRTRRSRDRRRSRSPRRRHSRRKRSSSGERSRSRDRKRAGSRERRRSRDCRQQSGERSKRDETERGRSGEKSGESEMKEQRSEEAKRKLTARLKELERERETRGKEKKGDVTSDSTSSDSD